MNQFYSWCLVIFLSIIWLVVLPLVFNIAKSKEKYRLYSTIGIRTTNAVKSSETWKYAQKTAARYAIFCGIVQFVFSAAILGLNLFSKNLFLVVVTSLFVLLMISLVLFVEQQLKKIAHSR